MPVLNWIGKQQVVNHDKEVPFRLLKKDSRFSVGESENLLIKGDNLEALKALMPYYAGKVKCIYIDPPYNTGNEKWVYNDKVNSPEIRKWLGKVVGSEGEDLNRHDKWLCMIYPRLKLLRDLLSDDGVIFVSIDDDEQHHLRLLLDEVFGKENFITNIIWQKKFSPQNDAKYFSDMHDFIVVYAKHKNDGGETNGWIRNLLPRTEAMDERYSNPDNDPRGDWASGDLLRKDVQESGLYTIKTPKGRVCNPSRGTSWRVPKYRYNELVAKKRIWFGKDGMGVPRIKRFRNEVQEGVVPVTIWFHSDVGHNQEAKQELKQIFPDAQLPFETPKPVRLLKRILQLATDKDSLILDSFAGSGTTGQAVLNLNKEDHGKRKFILVEMEGDIAEDITAKRLKRVINGYSVKGKRVKGLGGEFQFMRLGATLFDKDGFISEDVTFKDLAQYIYFIETKTAINSRKIKGVFIGEKLDTEYYLIFNGIKKNVLDKKIIKKISKNKKPKVVYADRCLLGKTILNKYHITFKQIPYEVKVY